jgi:hypothetical protein
MIAAPLVVTAVVTGCSAAHSTPTANLPSAARTSAAPNDPAAARLVARAIAATRALRSYTFDATQTVAANAQVRAHLTGRVVRGVGVAYDLLTGAKHTQVVRLGAATYVRAVPGRWAKLAHPSRTVDPTTGLLTVLQGLTSVTQADATTVHGALPATAAKRAGIPTDGRPANVTVTTTLAGHVVTVSISTSTTVATRSVTVSVVTTYGRFDRAPPIHRPA